MATVDRFEDLDVWKAARILDQTIFDFSSRNPFAKDFELQRQIRKSSGSVMDNIAEGFERGGRAEFIQFLAISKGSAGELRSQLYRAFDRKYIAETDFNKLLNSVSEISKMLQGFIVYLKKSELKGSKYK